jgi:hypothetical protein
MKGGGLIFTRRPRLQKKERGRLRGLPVASLPTGTQKEVLLKKRRGETVDAQVFEMVYSGLTLREEFVGHAPSPAHANRYKIINSTSAKHL